MHGRPVSGSADLNPRTAYPPHRSRHPQHQQLPQRSDYRLEWAPCDALLRHANELQWFANENTDCVLYDYRLGSKDKCVSDTQMDRRFSVTSDLWSRRRLNTVSGMRRITLRSTLPSATTMTKGSAYRASGGGRARNGSDCT